MDHPFYLRPDVREQHNWNIYTDFPFWPAQWQWLGVRINELGTDVVEAVHRQAIGPCYGRQLLVVQIRIR